MFSEMKKLKSLVIVMVYLTLATNIYANTPPVVSNVTAAQREDNSNLIDIYYDLDDAEGDTCTVWVMVSDNNGESWRVPADSFSGAFGQGIDPGINKHVVWDAGQDMPGKSGNFKARVLADDGNESDSMVLVPGGWFPYQNVSQPEDWIFVDSFLIDKYECTNLSYCQFLNNADPDGEHWYSGMEIDRMGDFGNYYYEVHPGRENYPVVYINYYDAEAFAAWKSSQTGLTYRLPTEQEWEKAAGWDPIEQHHYTYGFHSDTIDCSKCNYNNCVGGTTIVGSYDPYKSYYGCYDMSGNAVEWTSSMMSPEYPDSRVVRGGRWSLNATYCAVTPRGTYAASFRNSYTGFRLVQDVPNVPDVE
jgi:formylglycine-generating enzyme required for sulfatase activity